MKETCLMLLTLLVTWVVDLMKEVANRSGLDFDTDFRLWKTSAAPLYLGDLGTLLFMIAKKLKRRAWRVKGRQ